MIFFFFNFALECELSEHLPFLFVVVVQMLLWTVLPVLCGIQF